MSKEQTKDNNIENDFQSQEFENETMENQDEIAENEIETLQGELKKERDNFLRLFAEFENYKKRTTKERIELYSTANREVVTAMLPIVDDFERGLLEVQKSEDKALLDGMTLIYNKFKNTLDQKGLKVLEVNQGDIFDAEIHEAISQIPAPSKK